MDDQLTPQKVQQQYRELLTKAVELVDKFNKAPRDEVEVTEEEKEAILQRVAEKYRDQMVEDDLKQLKLQEIAFKERLALIEEYNTLIHQVFDDAWSRTVGRFFKTVEENIPDHKFFSDQKEAFKDFTFQVNTPFDRFFDLPYWKHDVFELKAKRNYKIKEIYNVWLERVVEKIVRPLKSEDGEEIKPSSVPMWDWIAQYYFGKEKMIDVPRSLRYNLNCTDFQFEAAFELTDFFPDSYRGMHWNTYWLGRYARPFSDFLAPETLIGFRQPRRKPRFFTECYLDRDDEVQLFKDECDSRM